MQKCQPEEIIEGDAKKKMLSNLEKFMNRPDTSVSDKKNLKNHQDLCVECRFFWMEKIALLSESELKSKWDMIVTARVRPGINTKMNIFVYRADNHFARIEASDDFENECGIVASMFLPIMETKVYQY